MRCPIIIPEKAIDKNFTDMIKPISNAWNSSLGHIILEKFIIFKTKAAIVRAIILYDKKIGHNPLTVGEIAIFPSFRPINFPVIINLNKCYNLILLILTLNIIKKEICS